MKDQRKSRCLFCSLGCDYVIETLNGEAVNLEYDRENGVWGGALCAKGNYILEMINHPMRLAEPAIGSRAGSWKDALGLIARKLEPFAGSKSAGLILEGDASVEDVVTARFFAEKCLGSDRVAVNFSTGDDAVYRGLDCTELAGRFAEPDTLVSSACTVAVGDPFEVAPVSAGKILQGKHAGRRHMFAVISDCLNRTSRFASHRVIAPERTLLAGLLGIIAEKRRSDGPSWLAAVGKSPAAKGLDEIADAFIRTSGAILVLETRDPVVASLAAACVLAAGDDKKIFVTGSYANARAMCEVFDGGESVDTILDDIDNGSLKALIVLGGDLVKARPERDIAAALAKLDFLVAASAFENAVTALADPVLPAALWMEVEGTWNGALLNPVIDPPGAALSYGEILRRLTAKMGYDSPPVHERKVLEKSAVTAEKIHALMTAAEESPVKSVVASTVLRAGDGALTDNMSWNALMGREPW